MDLLFLTKNMHQIMFQTPNARRQFAGHVHILHSEATFGVPALENVAILCNSDELTGMRRKKQGGLYDFYAWRVLGVLNYTSHNYTSFFFCCIKSAWDVRAIHLLQEAVKGTDTKEQFARLGRINLNLRQLLRRETEKITCSPKGSAQVDAKCI